MGLREERLSRGISANSRRKILRLLINKEFTVKEIATSTQMSVSLASRHLKLLYDLGFLNVRTKSPHKFYSLRIKEIASLLAQYDNILTKNVREDEDLSRAIRAKSRRNILKVVAEKEINVKEVAKQTKMSVSLASRHLKMLSDLGFLNFRTKSPHKFYSLKIKELQEFLINYGVVLSKL